LLFPTTKREEATMMVPMTMPVGGVIPNGSIGWSATMGDLLGPIAMVAAAVALVTLAAIVVAIVRDGRVRRAARRMAVGVVVKMRRAA
jgi:hypothetical protein